MNKKILKLRKKGLYLDLCTTVPSAEYKYSARFVPNTDIEGTWNSYQHADTIKKVIKLAYKEVS